MIDAIFVFLSIPWFVLLAAYSVIVCWTMRRDDRKYEIVGPLIATVALAAAVILFGDVQPWLWDWTGVRDRCYLICFNVAGYLAVGCAWIIYYWYAVFLDRAKERYEELRHRWLETKGFGGDAVPEDARDAWVEYLASYRESSDSYDARYPYRVQTGRDNFGRPVYGVRLYPLAREHKAKIFTWWMWWPWSVASYLVWDFIRNIFNRVFTFAARAMDSLAKRRFADVQQDIARKE